MKAAKTFLKFILIMLSTMAFTACSGDTWKEEVLLHDGQKIIVERSQSYGGRSEPGKSSTVKEHRISFTSPGSKERLTWTSEYGEDLGRANFNLLAVHVLAGTPYLLVKPNLCLSYNKWGRPNPPYIIFKYADRAWQRIDIKEFPVEFKTFNVIINNSRLLDIRKLQTAEGYVPAEGVQGLNNSLEQPEYRSILREPLSKGRIVEMCGDRILYKGHWIVPDSPTAKAIIDAQQK